MRPIACAALSLQNIGEGEGRLLPDRETGSRRATLKIGGAQSLARAVNLLRRPLSQ